MVVLLDKLIFALKSLQNLLEQKIIAVDTTLTKSGQAADAKAVGDRLSTLSEEIVTASESKVAAHNTGTDTHSDIRLLIHGLTDRLNALADSDDTTLDQLSEVVAYIKSNRSLIEAITTSKVSVADIVNNLTTNVANKPLSASQGVALKELIDAISIPSDYIQAPVAAEVGQTIVVKSVDENGKPTEWETVDFQEQIQSDWEQNDDSSKDYIKNRPFYINKMLQDERGLTLTNGEGESTAYFGYVGGSDTIDVSVVMKRDDGLILNFTGTATYVGNPVYEWTTASLTGNCNRFPSSTTFSCKWSNGNWSITSSTDMSQLNGTYTVYCYSMDIKQISDTFIPDTIARTSDIPAALPNPNTLTFTGAVTGRYDGSAPLSVEIPSGGGGSGATIELDTTLTQSGQAADAKAVGDALNKVTAGAVVGRFFGKVANFLGDSQTDDAGNYKSVFFYDWLKDILGLSATNNYGYSGTTIMPIEGQTRSFLERYTSMSDDADLIVVWGGTNDYHYGHALGAVDDTENTTFCGALNNLCKGLIAKYPQKSILFVTPTPRGNIASAVATQKEYADAIIDVCAKYCIPVFDAFRKCNMPIIADSDRRYTADGLHLNDLGHEILGKSMANFILYSEMAGAQPAWGENGGDNPDVPDPVVNVTGVTLNKNTHSLAIGETVQLAATIEPTNATNQNISWSASNGNCTVNNGLVTAVTAGDCTITATTEDGNHTASCAITVSYSEAVAPTSPVDGKTITFTSACVHTTNMSNIVCLVSADDLANKSGAVVIEAKISNATQTITGGRGMDCYQDESGEVGNNAFKTPSVGSYVQTTVDGDTITSTTTYYPDMLSYPYVKFPLSFTPGAYPVSFDIVSLTLSIGGEYVQIQKVGAFTANEGYSES